MKKVVFCRKRTMEEASFASKVPTSSFFVAEIQESASNLSLTSDDEGNPDDLIASPEEEDDYFTIIKKRKRGRPSKLKSDNNDRSVPDLLEVVDTNAGPRKRGRPPGKKKDKPQTDKKLVPAPVATFSDGTFELSTLQVTKRGRGRPRKYPLSADKSHLEQVSTSVLVSPATSSNAASPVPQSPLPSKDFPSDLQIAAKIQDIADDPKKSPDEVHCQLEEYFGVNLDCRKMYIVECYNIMIC